MHMIDSANLLRGFDERALELVVAQRHVQRLVDLVIHIRLPIDNTQVAAEVAASAHRRLPAADPDVLLAGGRWCRCRRRRSRCRLLRLLARVRHFGLLAGRLLPAAFVPSASCSALALVFSASSSAARCLAAAEWVSLAHSHL